MGVALSFYCKPARLPGHQFSAWMRYALYPAKRTGQPNQYAAWATFGYSVIRMSRLSPSSFQGLDTHSR
jgi:hypothetical protein